MIVFNLRDETSRIKFMWWPKPLNCSIVLIKNKQIAMRSFLTTKAYLCFKYHTDTFVVYTVLSIKQTYAKSHPEVKGIN